MAGGLMVLAYFGPEVQLPLFSLIGSIVGLVLMLGAYPLRLFREMVRGWKALATSGRPKT